MNYLKYLLTISILLCLTTSINSQSSLNLWYKQPANLFEESLVLGNGKMGATVFGGINSEKIYLNDATLWSGGPVNANMNPDAHKYIPAIRHALKNENYKRADSLYKFIQGSFSQSYAPLGTLFIDFNHQSEAMEYHRELNISEARSKTKYVVDGITYTREYFVSHPDQIMVIKLNSSQKGALNFTLRFNSLLKFEKKIVENTYKVNGYAPYHAEPSYRGDMPNAVRFDKEKGTRFSSYFKLQKTEGTIFNTDSTLSVNNATEAIILVSIATSFNGFDKEPAKEGVDNKEIALRQLENASKKSYQDLKNAHIKDYQTYFNRVSFNLGQKEAPKLSTDERLKLYTEGKEDKNLEVLYFQFGRYLLISCSRTPEVPANLQGIWNPYIRPPWSSNYTVNINVEENYWLAESGNLSEMHQSLLSFIKNIAKTGKITAETFYGVKKGWTAAHNSDIWAMSNPVGDFGKGDPVWANWNMGGTWLSTHLWEHYAFTQDINFLRSKAYPLMKGAAEFCSEWLITDKNGYLITSPSTSPENLYKTPWGYVGATLYGATCDLAMIRELFSQTIQAAEILDIDLEFRKKLKDQLKQLYPYQIGEKGNLQEWYHDWEDNDPQHRHQTHLFGLYPGHHITPEQTPELAEACKKTLKIKGDESTGWSKGWRINLWARLQDGNHAYKMYRELLSYVDPTGEDEKFSEKGGTYPNLLDAHPPFQIDGNFGGAAGVIEMLMQSTERRIHLLPALPDNWPTGSIKGICARGGYELSFNWEEGVLRKVTVFSKKGGKTTLVYQNEEKGIELGAGGSISIVW